MPRPEHLETIELDALAHVSGGGSSAPFLVAFVMNALRRRRAAAQIAPVAPGPAPAQPAAQLEVNGKKEELVRGADGSLTFDNTKKAAAAPAQPAQQ
jgi:uncharacterized protein (TIGR03382 family)